MRALWRDGRERRKRLGQKLALRPEAGSVGSQQLPWISLSLDVEPRPVKAVWSVATGPLAHGSACSRGASGGFSRSVRRLGTVAPRASRRHVVGGVGGHRGSIGRVRTVKPVVRRRVAGIGSGSGNGASRNGRPQAPAAPIPRARASAQPEFRKMCRVVRATGRAATSCSSCRRVLRSSIAVRRRADRRYGGCASGNGAGGRGGGEAFPRGRGQPAALREAFGHVVTYCSRLFDVRSLHRP